MDDILAEIRENVARLPDEELIRIVTVDRGEYRQEAVATATEELSRRRVVVPPPVVPQSVMRQAVVRQAVVPRAGVSRSAVPGFVEARAAVGAPIQMLVGGDLSSALPRMWPGFVFALAFFVAEMREALTNPEDANRVTWVPVLIALGGWVYWIWCMRRIRATILEASGDPTVQPHSRFRSFFVLHNPAWILTWAQEVAEFVNKRSGRTALDARWSSLALIAGLLLSRVDASLSLAVVFSVGAYIRNRLVTALGPLPESGGAITPS